MVWRRAIAGLWTITVAVLLVGCSSDVSAPTGAAAADLHASWVRDHYQKAAHRVPMRDGVALYTQVYLPRDQAEPLPILLVRTPYSIGSYGDGEFPRQLGPSPELDRSGYIFVFQDVRGKFESEGEFEVMRRLRQTPDGVDESTDTFDTIDWLLANVVNHNGRVGQWGISYPGWQTVMGMIEPHPALGASSPQASPADMFIGDDWHHNGAFRLMYAFSWLAGNARRRDQPGRVDSERFDYGTPWGYEFFLELGTLARIDERFFHGEVPAWNEFMTHGTYDDYWQSQDVVRQLGPVAHPVLSVAGWFDAEDFYGPMAIYADLEGESPTNQSTLVVGPWRHGGWRSMDGDSLGCIDFGSDTSHHFQRQVQLPFFERHLKDRGDWQAPEAVMFETGRNAWRTFNEWPPSDAVTRNLYLHPGGKLAFVPPAASSESPGAGFDAYTSDPARPVPFSAEIRTTQGHLWMIEDQRFAATRPDVLVYQTEPLEQDLTIAGPITARLFVSTSGTDSDFIVKLIDVFPGDAANGPAAEACGVPLAGFQMLVAGEVLRAKFRDSWSDPRALRPGEVTAMSIDLRDRFHTFLAGHRIMVQIQSSWFPVIDRNPQRFLDIYTAEPADFVPATQKLFRAPASATHLELRVLGPGSSPPATSGVSNS